MSLVPRGKGKSIVDASRLSGPEKAAVVLLSLGEDHGTIWRALDEDEIKEVSQAMASLGTVSSNAVEELLVEFVSGMSGAGAIMGSFEQTQKLLNAFLPSEKVDTLMEEIRGPAGRTMWDKLGNVNEAVLANYLKNEYPQTVAVILSKIKSESAGRIRALMFVFEDLSKLDPGGVQTLLRGVEKDQLGLALKGASDALREMFFSNMSERASKIMREDMESMGPVRLRDVDAAQMAMVQVAKDLAAKGEIMLAGSGGDDELIY